jgi:hypothetical protein
MCAAAALAAPPFFTLHDYLHVARFCQARNSQWRMTTGFSRNSLWRIKSRAKNSSPGSSFTHAAELEFLNYLWGLGTEQE